MDKAAEKRILILQLGKVLAPISELAERAIPPTATDYQVVSARGISDCERWNNLVNQFATLSGVRFGQLAGKIMGPPHNLVYAMSSFALNISDDAERQKRICSDLEKCQEETLASIDLVPIEWTARLHQEKTPFTVYLGIFEAIATAKRRVHYFDRYLDTEFFHLYMRDLNRALEIRLVTTKGKASYGVTNVSSVSRLVAGEFTNYQLIECLPDDMHERDLRVDDMVFFLGNSTKDAGEQPTHFAPGDSTPHGHGVLDRLMTKGTVIT